MTRFEFTDEERKAVKALKDVCETEGIEFRSLFELAKYVLVCRSVAKDTDPKADKKRLHAAVSRLKKRNQFVVKFKLDEVDRDEAIEELESTASEFFVTRYTKDKEKRVVVAHHHAFAPTEYVCKDIISQSKFKAVEMIRYDLGAADMDEARRGITLVTISEQKLTMKRALRYIRLVWFARHNLDEMHPNRIRKVYSEVPAILAHLIPYATKLLPRKIAARIEVFANVNDLEAHLLPCPSEQRTLAEWIAERSAIYEETVSKLSL